MAERNKNMAEEKFEPKVEEPTLSDEEKKENENGEEGILWISKLLEIENPTDPLALKKALAAKERCKEIEEIILNDVDKIRDQSSLFSKLRDWLDAELVKADIIESINEYKEKKGCDRTGVEAFDECSSAEDLVKRWKEQLESFR